MPRVSRREFAELPLRVHALLCGIPLHDVWAVDLVGSRVGITLEDFLRAANGRLLRPSRLVRLLLNARFTIGRLFGWDGRRSHRATRVTLSDRLTLADRAASLAPPGERTVGMFALVYRFENEQLAELENRTVHAATLMTLVERAGGYRFYLAVYVRSVSRLTPLYLALIEPFRRFIVYPSLLRSVRATWNRSV